MRIFGIDPGSERTGYGCVDSDGSRHRLVTCGAITTKASATFPEKLLVIHSRLATLLAECRPDDLTALVVRAVLEKVPALDPQSIEDLILGCGQPAGESGFNIARVAAVLAGLHDVPGVTVNRYCSSSLQTIRMAAHAIKAGEGDVFVAAGVVFKGSGWYINDSRPTQPSESSGAASSSAPGRRTPRWRRPS